MPNSVRIITIGLGTHGREITRRSAEAGINVVAGVDPFHQGKDLGALVGSDKIVDITVVKSINDVDWASADAQLAVVAVKLPVPDVVAVIEQVLLHKIDVVTIVEDLFDLDSYAPELKVRLDTAAKAAGKTVVATGSQDATWAGLALQATGGVRNLRSIKLTQSLGVDGYPLEFLEWCGIGVTKEQFDEAARVAGETPSVFGAVLPIMARKLGLTIIEESREMRAITRDAPVASLTYGRDLAAGEPIGRYDLVVVKTAEGIELSAELETTAIMGNDVYSAIIDAEPRFELRHRIIPGSPSVDAIVINRIPDIIAAPAGLIATVDLPTPFYRHRIA